jgi:hypothetical protein
MMRASSAKLPGKVTSFIEHTNGPIVLQSMEIPPAWLVDAGVQDYVPNRPSYRCTAPHVLIATAHIERVVRTRPLDANGFCRDRMIRILAGIRDDDDIIPPVPLWEIGAGRYRLRDGTHRFYASLALGFSHLPSEMCEPL